MEGRTLKTEVRTSRTRTRRTRLPHGAHMSIAGGTPNAVDDARSVGAGALQIFVKNNNRWQGKIISDEEAAAFRERVDQAGLLSVVAHASYLINLASPDEALRTRSIEAMLDELERCHRLGLSHLVVHPGAHMGEGEAAGIARVAASLDTILERFEKGRVVIALETTAGQGSSLGYRFEQLRDTLGQCRRSDRVAVCLDTCHAFAAGYDFRSVEGFQSMVAEFDRLVGLDKLQIFHVNDSKRELGSRVDRHQHIGKGEIGLNGFRWILNDPRLTGVPKILETPKGKNLRMDRVNLGKLRRLIVGKRTG